MVDAGNVQVHPSNAQQAGAWDGDEGSFWAANADRFDDAIGVAHRLFLEAAAIGGAEQVLDVGCGNGQTTRDAARAARSGAAFGVDLSSRMIEEARRRAAVEGVANATFHQADAQVHPFDPASFDVAISRMGAMFFGDPVAAFTNLRTALRPGGRLVLLAWQALDENEWIVSFRRALAAGRDMPAPPPDAPSPFSLADPVRVERILGEAGFTDVSLDPVRAPMCFGATSDEAYDFVLGTAGWMLDGLDEGGRAAALDALRATLADHEGADGVQFDSASWIIGARRS